MTDLKLHRKLENTEAQPLKLHQQVINSPSSVMENNVKHGYWPHGKKSVRDSLELEQLGFKERTEWKDTNQHIFEYAQQKEMKEGQLKDEIYKGLSVKPATRSGGCVMEKEQIIVA